MNSRYKTSHNPRPIHVKSVENRYIMEHIKMKKLIMAVVLSMSTLFFMSCSYPHIEGDMIVIQDVLTDPYNLTSKYYICIRAYNEIFIKQINVYFVDTVNAYQIGDTIFISSLVKKKKNVN